MKVYLIIMQSTLLCVHACIYYAKYIIMCTCMHILCKVHYFMYMHLE